MKIIKKPSPNYSPSGYVKIGHQIHKTLGLMPGCLDWLTNPVSNASAHLLVTRDGTIYELVDLKNRSWTAGRINRPSKRAKLIMPKKWGIYVKPGHYLIQWEFECLANQTYTDAQYNVFVDYCKEKKLPVIDLFLLTHKDTAVDKSDLEVERRELLDRYKMPMVKTTIKPKKKTKIQIKQQIIELVNSL